MFYTIINILFIVVAISLIFLQRSKCRFLNTIKDANKFSSIGNRNCNAEQPFSLFIEKNFNKLTVLLFIITAFTSVFRLGDIPYGLNVDEAGMAYDAISLVNYGVDRYLKPYPVYFINFGGGQNAMYTYLSALLINFLGYSPAIIRIPAVVLRLCSFIAIYFILKSDWREHACQNYDRVLIFLFLFSVCPYFTMQSRWGLESNLLVGFFTISVCLLVYAISNNDAKLFFISGISFGLTLYTYALSYIIIPLFLFWLLIYLISLKKVKILQVFSLSIPIVILAVPLFLMILVNKGYVPEIQGTFTIPQLHFYRGDEVSFANIIDNLYIFITILSVDNPKIFGNQLYYNAVPYFGTVYYFSIPFFVIGIISSSKKFMQSVKNRIIDLNIFFVPWFWSVIFCQLLILYPNINKSNAVFIPVFYFITEGIIRVFSSCKNAKAVVLVIIVCYLLNFSLFFNYYHTQYNKDSKQFILWATDYIDAVKFSKNLTANEIQVIKDITFEPYIYVLLENKISPYHFSRNNIKIINDGFEQLYVFRPSDSLKAKISESNQNKDDCAYIVRNNEYWYNIFKDSGMKHKIFGNICIYYK